MKFLFLMIITMMSVAVSINEIPNTSHEALMLWLAESIGIENMLESLQKNTTHQFESIFTKSIPTCDKKSLQRLSSQWVYEVKRNALKLCQMKIPNVFENANTLLEMASEHYSPESNNDTRNGDTETNDLNSIKNCNYQTERKNTISKYKTISMINKWNTIEGCFNDLSYNLGQVLLAVKLPETSNQWKNCFHEFITNIGIPLFGRDYYSEFALNFTGTNISFESQRFKWYEKQWTDSGLHIPEYFSHIWDEVMSSESYRIYEILETIYHFRNSSLYLNKQHGQYPVGEMMWDYVVLSCMNTVLLNTKENKNKIDGTKRHCDQKQYPQIENKDAGLNITRTCFENLIQNINSIQFNAQSLPRKYELIFRSILFPGPYRKIPMHKYLWQHKKIAPK